MRLSDVAHVYDGPEDIRRMGLFNGQRAVNIIISRQPGANIVATVDALKAQLPALQAALPAEIKLHVAADRTTTIRASLHEVEITLVIATLLVVFVVSIFLRSLRATIVPAVAIVVSLLGTLGVMYLAGFSLNNLSLMALTVATGFVVDDAIVVLENISRHIEDGMRREHGRAARRARGRLHGDVDLVQPGRRVHPAAVHGRHHRPAVPRVRGHHVGGGDDQPGHLADHGAHARLAAAGARAEAEPVHRCDRAGVQGHHRLYEKSLDWALANRAAVLVLLVGTVVLNVFLMAIAAKGFFPEQDTGALAAGLRADQSISFHDMQKKLTQMSGSSAAIMTSRPWSPSPAARAPAAASCSRTQAEERARLQPCHHHAFAAQAGPGDRCPGLPQSGAGHARRRPRVQQHLSVHPAGRRSRTLRAAGAKLVELLQREPTLTDVDIDQQEGGAEVYVDVDRDTAARLGISARSVNAPCTTPSASGRSRPSIPA